MEKKITRRLVLTGVCSMLLMLVLCVFVFYTVFQRQAEQDLHIAAGVIATSYEQTPDRLQLEEYGNEDLRITLILSLIHI